MASAVRWKVSVKCALQCLARVTEVGIEVARYLFILLKSLDIFKVSVFISIVLFFINIHIFKGGQNTVIPLLQMPIVHDVAPVFPHHYFHESEGHGASLSSIKGPTDDYLKKYSSFSSLSKGIAPIVHVVWCKEEHFTFIDYLSVLSVFKMLKPSALYLHYFRNEPVLDNDGYYQFYPDLIRDIPVIIPVMLRQSGACRKGSTERMTAYLEILGQTGGLVLDSRTIISPSPFLDSVLNEKYAIGVKDGNPVMVASKVNVAPMLDSYVLHSGEFAQDCASPDSSDLFAKHWCVYTEANIFPRDVFSNTSDFAQLARWTGYGTSAMGVSQPLANDVVPNIVHYVWLGQRPFEYFNYLSLLSSLHVMEADSVYIHGDFEPLGDLWDKAKENPKVKFINRDFPSAVYGEPIVQYASHASDYLRGDVLLRYGGVYIDWDVLILQPLSSELRRHNTTVNVDWPKTGAFPDVINMGVLVAAQGAPFLRRFLESYRWYLDKHWSYNAIHMPYKVYEKVPSTLNIDVHLQVSCAHFRCHATWLSDYKSESCDHLRPGVMDWQTDSFAMHWTHPDPPEFSSKEELIHSTTTAAKIGRYVLKKAGEID